MARMKDTTNKGTFNEAKKLDDFTRKQETIAKKLAASKNCWTGKRAEYGHFKVEDEELCERKTVCGHDYLDQLNKMDQMLKNTGYESAEDVTKQAVEQLVQQSVESFADDQQANAQAKTTDKQKSPEPSEQPLENISFLIRRDDFKQSPAKRIRLNPKKMKSLQRPHHQTGQITPTAGNYSHPNGDGWFKVSKEMEAKLRSDLNQFSSFLPPSFELGPHQSKTYKIPKISTLTASEDSAKDHPVKNHPTKKPRELTYEENTFGEDLEDEDEPPKQPMISTVCKPVRVCKPVKICESFNVIQHCQPTEDPKVCEQAESIKHLTVKQPKGTDRRVEEAKPANLDQNELTFEDAPDALRIDTVARRKKKKRGRYIRIEAINRNLVLSEIKQSSSDGIDLEDICDYVRDIKPEINDYAIDKVISSLLDKGRIVLDQDGLYFYSRISN